MPTLAEIERVALAALARAGVPEAAAQTQLALLLDAELSGTPSHGLMRLPRVLERLRNRVADPRATGRHVWRGQALLSVEGERGLGPVVARHALDALAGRVRETGIALAALRNCDHLGMLAWYARAAAERGHILIALTVSEALVHPWGGRRAMIGTNPIAVGVPADPHPFVFDMATSVVSMGRIHDHANRGQPLEPGWALDARGEPTTDAQAAKSGAIAPFGGAKGYGLALAFEVLVAALADSALGTDVTGTLDSATPCTKGDVFILADPAAGTGRRIADYLDLLRGSPAAAAQPVRIPGDRARTRREALRRDPPETVRIDLPAPVWAAIRSYC